MNVKIHSIKLGLDNCYVIQGEGTIIVDGGAPNQIENFKKALEELSIKPDSISLIVLTHGHWDHVGSVKDIKEFTGAPVALHRFDKDWLEKSLKPLAPGITTWGRIFHKFLEKSIMPKVHVPATKVDMVLGDNEISLTEYGIPGKIIYTPGHSLGSVSVLLDSGEAFVGDLAMSAFPARLSPGLTIFADDLQKVKQSCKVLINKGARTIYPAHGKPFSVDVIKKAI